MASLRRLKKLILAGTASSMIAASPAIAEELVVWHDLGDNGIAWFEALNELYQAENPDVTITSVSFPTDQWFGKVIAALNTNTAPDLIYNNYERVIRIENQTDKVADLSDLLAAQGDLPFLTESDKGVAMYDGKMIILPIQRVQMAFGARKSWLEAVGEDMPQTWDDVMRVAKKFQTEDPDGNGADDTFGMALQAARPRDLIHMLDLYTFGAGLRHTLIDPDGNIVIDQPEHKAVLTEFLKSFTDYGLVSPDTVNHSFGEMYQLIEGGRAGMFRVGDWNVKKWDGEDVLGGDFVIGEWPSHGDSENAVVIGGMRGVAVPENSPNKDIAMDFAAFMLSAEAQKASLENVGAAVRGDFDIEGFSERRLYFAKPEHDLNAYDFPESVHAFYPELEAEYHRVLLDAIVNPPDDWASFIDETAEAMRAKATELAG
ncbi:MAG: extracellular solute-binding protein [Roseitalea sp.]|jgi:ABC-type glycerol-3-phosphate transport system substrate-binding protein|nr:extracellular solute-binding protein [Roseitalea sp.]MBO6720991.1 extracellular solute-binding protein [Roseitalea sp.]MBO6742937.1 extracellular solute-binding protein [Roseitalea sp.]